MDRRSFLHKTLLGLSAAPLVAPLAADVEFLTDPFTLGIASGDVTDSSAILWTRLAPTPLEANGGMAPISVPVQWQLSLDASMSQVIQRGEAIASPTLAHSVHVDVQELEPNREYWYQFTAATQASPIGRTKTLPDMGGHPGSVRFITASCQNYSNGYFIAYEHMVRDQPDFIVHLGDYIYDTSFDETFRMHETERMPVSLADYRRRHALYKTDKHLRHAHSQIPFFTTIDNHDAIEDMDPEQFARRVAAYQAWYEHMPVRGYSSVDKNRFDLCRKISLGNLMQISLLDSRQFRDKQNISSNSFPDFAFGIYRERSNDVFDKARSMLGMKQEKWLTNNLLQNQSTWNVIASPSPFLSFRMDKDGKDLRYVGAWDNYPANRSRVADAISNSKTGHPIIVSGDVHSFWASDGRLATDVSERIPVVEFITSSISANWPAALSDPITANLAHNPQVKFYKPEKRGYLLHEVNESEWKATARAIDNVRDEQSPVSSLASFVVTKGESGFSSS